MLFRSVFLFALVTLGGNAIAADRPNVLLLLVDDLKPSFGAYGDSWVHSPNLDRLAARGMRFDMAYCNQAVCAPSRNNLLVGSRSTSTGIYSLGYHFRKAVPEAVTLPQHFKNNGYHSAGIGKVFHIGHGNVNDERSWSVPFQPDKVIDYVLPESTGGQLTREEAYFSNQKLGEIKSLPRGAAYENADVDDDAYADGRIAVEGMKRLHQYKSSGEPFFLALGFTKPHLPFCAPRKYWDLYDPIDLPLATFTKPPDGAPSFAGKTIGELNQYKPVPQTPPLSGQLTRTLIHGYYASLSYMDAQIGRVLDELDRLELDKNTIVVLWGDHGYHLGDHGTWTKHTNYEQANRIPILISARGVTKPDSSTKALIETVDIYPTIVELAGLSMPDGPQPLDGKSFVSVLRDGQKRVRDHAYHCFPKGGRMGRAIRTERYRMVEWKPINGEGKIEYELYDYLEDPLETKNLAAEREDVLVRMKSILATHPEARQRAKEPKRRSRSDNASGADQAENADGHERRDRRFDSPLIENLTFEVVAEGKADRPSGVVIAQGGQRQGFALHFVDGLPTLDVRVNGSVSRISSPSTVQDRFRIKASLGEREMSLIVNGELVAKADTPGLIPVQPQDSVSVGRDEQTAAGDYEAPNPFNGTITSTRVSTSGPSRPPKVAHADVAEKIREGMRSHDKSLFVKSGWIRDPYVVLGPDDHFYLTGTTPNPDDPRQKLQPYNTGLGDESIVGWQMQVWKTKDFTAWDSLDVPFDLTDGIWATSRPKLFAGDDRTQWRLWAPELHFIDDRWALVHTSPAPVKGANLSLSEGAEVCRPWSNPMGTKIARRHDPSLFRDDGGTWWLVWGATSIAPLKPDFTDIASKPVKIGPSGETSKMGHEGCLIRKIHGKYVLFGTGWSTAKMRRGSYNLYYATADKITGPYSERQFVGRFLGHGTPFQDREGRWWSTAFYNGNVPPLERDGIAERDLSHTAQTINQLGTTIVPLDVRVLASGALHIRAKDPDYAVPGPDEVQDFEL